MNYFTILAFVGFASVVTSAPSELSFSELTFDSNDSISAPRYSVNLDLPPCERWKQIAKLVNVTHLRKGVEDLLHEVFPTEEMFHMAEVIAGKLDRYFQEPYSDELRCFSEASGGSLGDLVLINIYYELVAHGNSSSKDSTSIVTLNKNGKIIQGKSMNNPAANFLRNITIVVDFLRNNKTVYTGVTFYGYLGLLSGVRNGAFSLSGNTRFYGSLYLNLLAVLDGAQLTFYTARRVLDESSDYPSALNQLTNTPTAAPIYFIVGGKSEGEGAIVVRNGIDVAVVKHLQDYVDHDWFLVETNYDPWKQPPKSDDRRDQVIKEMMKIGKDKMDANQLYQILSSPSILNNETVTTTLMSASNSSLFQTKIRFDAATTEI